MERILRTVLIVTAAIAAACAPRERTLVLLSTNDMHAKIRNFPRLAAAVEACRDTAQLVVLVDAGDRWTGNAYVDRAATPGMPMIALMNGLGYDVATLGNHEFDHGQAFLGRMIDSMDFEVVCANVVSDTCTFPPLPPYTVLEEGGFKGGCSSAYCPCAPGACRHPVGEVYELCDDVIVQQCAEDDQPVETGVPFVKIHNVSSFVIQSLEMWQGSPFGRAGAGAPERAGFAR